MMHSLCQRHQHCGLLRAGLSAQSVPPATALWPARVQDFRTVFARGNTTVACAMQGFQHSLCQQQHCGLLRAGLPHSLCPRQQHCGLLRAGLPHSLCARQQDCGLHLAGLTAQCAPAATALWPAPCRALCTVCARGNNTVACSAQDFQHSLCLRQQDCGLHACRACCTVCAQGNNTAACSAQDFQHSLCQRRQHCGLHACRA